METLAMYLFYAGTALTVLGLLWLLIAAFRHRIWWGLASLFVLPLFLFAVLHRRKALWPVVVLLLGVATTGAAVSLAAYAVSVDLGPREKQVDGEVHLTLTGWDGTDYSVLRARPQTVVLQLANPDVTDQTLEYLRPMTRLRELDLSGTQVTDAGLAVLRGLPNLQDLRLRNTKVTDAGFQEYLAPLESLQRLDLRGTGVSAETAKAWREAKNGRRVMR
jgi:hypothetical protein